MKFIVQCTEPVAPDNIVTMAAHATDCWTVTNAGVAKSSLANVAKVSKHSHSHCHSHLLLDMSLNLSGTSHCEYI